jgi:hypothetical protein
MAVMTESQIVAAELERVDPRVPLLFERDAMFYANIEKRPVEVVSARDMRIPLEIRPGGYFGYFDTAGGDMGRGAGPQFEKALISTVNFRYAVEWHKKTQWATDDARKSVVNAVRHLLAVSMKEFRRMVDANLMTKGDGVIATVSATGAGNSVICATVNDGYGVRLLRVGQKVNFYSADLLTSHTPTEADEREVTSIDADAKTFVYSGAVIAAVVAGVKVVSSGLRGASPVGILGVPYHHDSSSTGAWLSLSRAAFPEVRAGRIAASGALALPHARRALNKIGERLGLENGVKMKAWMHPCQVQQYEGIAQLLMQIEKQPSAMQGADTYFEMKQLAGVPIQQHFNWDKTRIDYVVDEIWGRAEMHKAGFYEEEGRRMFEARGTSGGVAAATMFYLVASFNTYINNPPASVYISDLTIPTGY